MRFMRFMRVMPSRRWMRSVLCAGFCSMVGILAGAGPAAWAQETSPPPPTATTSAGNLFVRVVEPQAIIDHARLVLREMVARDEYLPLREDLREAHGVLIIPRVVRGGFFVGGSGGLGVFMAWDAEQGDYSPVAFYSLTSVSLGLQFGGEVAEVVMVAKTRKAVDSLYTSAFRLGGDASVAAGPVGMGRSASVQADFLFYARSQGAFIGMSLEGSHLRVRDDFNEAYYHRAIRPAEIIEGRRVDRPGSLELRQDLLRYRSAPLSMPSGTVPSTGSSTGNGSLTGAPAGAPAGAPVSSPAISLPNDPAVRDEHFQNEHFLPAEPLLPLPSLRPQSDSGGLTMEELQIESF